jgi:hypothetical protein
LGCLTFVVLLFFEQVYFLLKLRSLLTGLYPVSNSLFESFIGKTWLVYKWHCHVGAKFRYSFEPHPWFSNYLLNIDMFECCENVCGFLNASIRRRIGSCIVFFSLFLLLFCKHAMCYWTHFRSQIFLSHELVSLRCIGILEYFRCLFIDVFIVKRVFSDFFLLVH